ncbi:MAG: HAD family hydrolase [Planctomycetota bacterium]
MTHLIALWSGPRNISTAMMRSWEARGDTRVVDEPLYAHYLKSTGLDHPGAAEIIAAGETDLAKVAQDLTTPRPGDTIVYQKQMAHHVLLGDDFAWTDTLTNALLIREPREMLTSLLKVLPDADLAATGLPAQAQLMERAGTLPVVDARDVLEHPRATLAALCTAVGVDFTERMLAWPPGPRPTDGVWAKYWYASVNQSTGFAPYQPKPTNIPDTHADLLREAEAIYAELRAHKINPQD